MATFTEGDLVTLAWKEDTYLLAKIVYIENLTLHDLIHVLVYDTLLEGGPAGYDVAGEYVERTHPSLPDPSTLPVVIDHFAMTYPAFEECEPMAVGNEPVSSEDKEGYIVWVAMRRAQAERRGMIRHDIEDANEQAEYDDEEWDEQEVETEGIADDASDDTGDEPATTIDETPVNEGEPISAESDDGQTATVIAHTWHDTVFDLPISQALVELADIFRQEEFTESVVATDVLAQTEASVEEIDALVRQLVDDGDYGAGQELLLYGDPAADRLYEALRDTQDQQTVEDILQILGDMGVVRAYEHIAEFFSNRVDRLPDDDIAVAAARSFCYVVMLTGGAPKPLNDRLKLLERLDYPNLREDAENAIDAIHRQGVEIEDPTAAGRSTDPFSSM